MPPAPRLPVPPALPAAIRDRCPPLAPLPDRTIGALALADAEAARLYAGCQAKHDAAISAWDALVEALADARKASQ